MIVYISTPINARPERTFAEKWTAAKHRCEYLKEILTDDEQLRKDGGESGLLFVSPFDVVRDFRGVLEADALGWDVAAVLKADAVYLDHAWQSSKGCNLEYRAAKIYGKRIYEHDKM